MFIKSFSHSLKASKHIFAVYVDMEQICINLINLKVPICLFILLHYSDSKRFELLSVNYTLLSCWYLICVSFITRKKIKLQLHHIKYLFMVANKLHHQSRIDLLHRDYIIWLPLSLTKSRYGNRYYHVLAVDQNLSL